MFLIKAAGNEYSPCMSVHFRRSWGVTFVSGFTQLLEIFNHMYIDKYMYAHRFILSTILITVLLSVNIPLVAVV